MSLSHARLMLLVIAFSLPAAPLLSAEPVTRTTTGPVIDMHLHAFRLDLPPGTPACTGDQGVPVPTIDPQDEFDFAAFPGCDHPLLAPASDQALMDESIAELRRHDVRRAVTEGAVEDVAAWRAAAPDVIVPGVAFGKSEEKSIAEMRRLHAAGQLAVFGEVYAQYRGVRLDDARYEPYFALAEELDIPVGVHLGQGPPAAARFPGYETYRASLTTPFQLESVLHRHPGLRIYVMHYASPLVDEMIAMMFTHPNLYVDIALNNWGFPRAQFHDELKRLVDAGFGKRILFGSDQMYWPGGIGAGIESIETTPFLDAGQKRDILYNNAARFLRLSEAEIAADHAPR